MPGTITVSTYLTNIRFNLNEPVADVSVDPNAGANWTNAALIECLNKAKNDLFNLVRREREDYFETTGATISLNATTKEYALASDYRQMVGMKITTSGYEFLVLSKANQSTSKFKRRDKVLQGNSVDLNELVYDIIGNSTLKFADFPPTTLALSYDYIAIPADVVLGGSAVIQFNDDWRVYIEARASWWALVKTPQDSRLQVWDKVSKEYEEKILQNVSKRDISGSEYVEPYDPFYH